MEDCNCSMFCCTLLYVHSSIAIILMGKRELIALLNLSSWCLVMVEQLFLAVPRGCLQFVIVVFPDHTHLLFTNEDLMIDNLQYQTNLGASDHLVLTFDFVCYIPPNKGPPRRNFFKGDYDAMREVLQKSTWEFDHLESIDDIWNLFSDRLCQIITDFVPQSNSVHSFKKPWMNKNTSEAIDKK